MSDFIEGRNAVLEALRSGQDLKTVFIARGVKQHPTLDEIRTLSKKAGIRVKTVDRAELDRKSPRGSHQGVGAVAGSFEFASFTEVMSAAEESKQSLVVVLDHVTDPGNLGAIIRSIEVVGGDAVIVAKDRSAPVSAVVHKASAGATAHLPVVQVTNIARAIDGLKQRGYWVIGASEKSDTLVWDAPLEGRIALVMGAEGTGLSRLVSQACDLQVRLPVRGKVDSLNVAQATAVLAFEWLRRSIE